MEGLQERWKKIKERRKKCVCRQNIYERGSQEELQRKENGEGKGEMDRKGLGDGEKESMGSTKRQNGGSMEKKGGNEQVKDKRKRLGSGELNSNASKRRMEKEKEELWVNLRRKR